MYNSFDLAFNSPMPIMRRYQIILAIKRERIVSPSHLYTVSPQDQRLQGEVSTLPLLLLNKYQVSIHVWEGAQSQRAEVSLCVSSLDHGLLQTLSPVKWLTELTTNDLGLGSKRSSENEEEGSCGDLHFPRVWVELA